MVQTKDGASRSAWLMFLKQCAKDYQEMKKAKDRLSMPPPEAKRRRVTGKTSPEAVAPAEKPKKFAKLNKVEIVDLTKD